VGRVRRARRSARWWWAVGGAIPFHRGGELRSKRGTRSTKGEGEKEEKGEGTVWADALIISLPLSLSLLYMVPASYVSVSI